LKSASQDAKLGVHAEGDAADDPRFDRLSPLAPANAVAAILTVEGAYLLQLRDRKHGIFFPSHWGCFGGAIDPGETVEAALVRELSEELDLDVAPQTLRYFTRFDFDVGFAGLPIWRVFYEIELGRATLSKLTLHEGSRMELIAADALLAGTLPLTPYDAFALWFHINRGRLQG
jgi:8-oxo-dGTP pyrophosphatase MutT (NUDIX family)